MQKIEFEKSETKHNVARAFIGECLDGARYQFIAQKATDEGYNNLNTMLRTLAKNEMAHAQQLYNAIINNCATVQKNIEITAGYPFKSGTLVENIKNSFENELSESKNIYPTFAKIAEDEGYPDIAKLFLLISEVESTHHLQLTEIYEKMKANKLYKSTTLTKWKCSKCGHTSLSKVPWEICPLCKVEVGYVEIPTN